MASSSSKSNVPKRIASTRRRKMAAHPAAAAKSNEPKRRKMAATCACLPDELWDCIFKSFNNDLPTLKSLSVVSKQFLTITNRLRVSVTVTDETIPYLPRLFHRFPNLASVDLSRLSQSRDLGAILTEISTFSIDLRELSCNSIAANGLLALSKTMKNLSSFLFIPQSPFTRRMGNIKKNDILFIVDCFPLLEKIILRYPPLVSGDQYRKVDWSDQELMAVFQENIHFRNRYL